MIIVLVCFSFFCCGGGGGVGGEGGKRGGGDPLFPSAETGMPICSLFNTEGKIYFTM